MRLSATRLQEVRAVDARTAASTAPVDARPQAPGPHGARRRHGFDVVPVAVTVDVAAFLLAQWPVSVGRTPAALLLPLILAVNAAGRHYKPRIAPSLLDEFPSLAGRALVAGAITSAVLLLLDWPVHDGPVLTSLAFIVFASAGRALGYPLVRRNRRQDGAGQSTLIVGCGRVGNQLASILIEHPDYGLRPVGFIDDEPLVPPAERRVPLLGARSDLVPIMLEHDVRAVVFAFTSAPESSIVEIIHSCDRLACEILFVPRLYELHGAGHGTEMVWGLPVTRLSRASYRSLTWRTKRLFDVVLTSLGLIVLAPVMAACALAVRLEVGRGVIFRQERVGLDGERFVIVKFRTLQTDPQEDGSHQPWSLDGNSRVGPVGRVLRRTSLDELPQLWNILRGDMSLVGPRPERPTFVDQFTQRFPRYVARHRVPAGLTGWAQVNGLRGDTDIADRASFDNYYIENWSMWFDIKILLRTISQVARGRGQ